MSEREPYNGQPFYCATCGAGFGEFMACEDGECKLESEKTAKARQAKRIATTDKPQGKET